MLTLLLGEGNGNPLQCSCLENPRYGGAWRAAVYGVAQSRPRLKWLSSSSSSSPTIKIIGLKQQNPIVANFSRKMEPMEWDTVTHRLEVETESGRERPKETNENQSSEHSKSSTYRQALFWKSLWAQFVHKSHKLTPVFFPEKYHGQRSLAGHHP